MSDLSDRERELVEAAQVTFYNINPDSSYGKRLLKALRAYDPPKRKYTIAKWTELTEQQRVKFGMDLARFKRGEIGTASVWDEIREALSTEET